MLLQNIRVSFVLNLYFSVLLLQQSNGQNVESICSSTTLCKLSRYRTTDGTCNNMKNPKWGASFTTYNRLLNARYADGISAPPLAKDGSALPHARLVSLSVYPTAPIEDKHLTLNAMQYGQFIAHDMGLTLNTTGSDSALDQCCTADGKLTGPITGSKHCYSIVVPEHDPDFAPLGKECMQFARTTTDHEYGCGGKNDSAQQINGQTSYLDLSIVYSPNRENEKSLRLWRNGLLKSEHRLSQQWLPRSTNPSTDCNLGDPNEPCYKTGDRRVNQSPHLVILQTIFFREHNRIADVLGVLNPHWNDERIFQEAKKINIGQHQKITFYDLLPLLIGEDNMKQHKLIYNSKYHVNDYDHTIDSSSINEHAGAAFRFFHSQINGQLKMFNEYRQNTRVIRIGDNIDRPRILEDRNTSFDELTRGLASQLMLAADEYVTREMTNNFAKLPEALIGVDLKSICIQRDRDHGLAAYNDLREYCGLPRAKTFGDLLDVMKRKNVHILSQLYKCPDDIDLTVGGSLEKLVPGTQVGPTFLCIITKQFSRTRKGDRFFFENSGITGKLRGFIGFSLPQLKEIRKASMARLLCDNTHIEKIQLNSFKQISPKNKLLDCNQLPWVNLHLWKEW